MAETQAVTHTTPSVAHVSVINAPVEQVRGRTVLQIEKLEPKLAKQLGWLERRLYKHVSAIGKSALMVGQILTEINEILEPQKLFTYYLNRLVWLSPATAYRYMAAYKRVKERMPEAVVEKALASGIPLFGYSDEKPYGRYTDAVAQMPAPPKDEEAAEIWLADLKVKARDILKRPVRSIGVDVDRLARQLCDAYERVASDKKDAPKIERWLSTVVEKAVNIHRAKGVEGTAKPPATGKKVGRPRKVTGSHVAVA